MPWVDDAYIRNLLDTRERWGVLLSLTAVAGTLVFLSDHPHQPWLNAGPLVIGVFGSLFVLVVNCYYKQAEAFASAETDEARGAVRTKKWFTFAGSIRFLGWLHILAPTLVGTLAMVALFGLC